MNPSTIHPTLNTVMNESDFTEYLQDALLWANNENGQIDSVETFEDVGMLSSNEGLVVRMSNDSEFQITIVKSR